MLQSRVSLGKMMDEILEMSPVHSIDPHRSQSVRLAGSPPRDFAWDLGPKCHRGWKMPLRSMGQFQGLCWFGHLYMIYDGCFMV